MLPEATSQDLLYVAEEYGPASVSVYSYPQGMLVGTLSGLESPIGDCVDKAGNVFIVNFNTPSGAGSVVEYAHGGTHPIQTLTYPKAYFEGCAADPITGDLAVTEREQTSQNGGILVYPGATGSPTKYVHKRVKAPGYCAYDNAGNLYFDGTNVTTGNVQLAELPKSKKHFIDIMLRKRIESSLYGVGGVQWDGTYVVIGEGRTASPRHVHIQVYRISVNGSIGKLVGTTVLGGAHANMNFQFWIQGGTIISPYGSVSADERKERSATVRNGDNKIGLWTYPGGMRTLTIHDTDGPWAVTVSLAHQ